MHLLHCKKANGKVGPQKNDKGKWVSKKVSDIPVNNFAKNIKLFPQNFPNVELLRCKNIPHVESPRILSALRAPVFTYVKKRGKEQENVLPDRPTQKETKMKECSEYFLYTFIGCNFFFYNQRILYFVPVNFVKERCL